MAVAGLNDIVDIFNAFAINHISNAMSIGICIRFTQLSSDIISIICIERTPFRRCSLSGIRHLGGGVGCETCVRSFIFTCTR